MTINARIKAARAGDAARGFAVVADAINDLLRKIRQVAVEVSSTVGTLTGWIGHLHKETAEIAIRAADVLKNAGGADSIPGRMETSIASANQ